MSDKKVTVRLGLDGRKFKRGIRRAQKDLKEFRTSATANLKRVGTAGAVAAGAAVVIGAKFEQQMANVGAVAGATALEMDMLEKSARKMGAETAYSATQAAEAQQALAAAGMKTGQIIGALPAVLKYAGSQGASLEDSARNISAALNAFHLEADQATRVANVFAAATANSDLQIDNLGEAFSNVSATANTLGFTLEETTATLGLMANAGIKGGKAGTKLQAVMLKLNEVAASSKGAVGEALEGWNAGTDGMAGALKRLEAAGVDGDTVLKELGAKGGPVLAALLGQGSAALVNLTGSITDTQKAFEMYDRMMDTTQGRFQILLSTLQEAGIRVYKVFEGPIKRTLETLKQAVEQNFDKIENFARGVVDVLKKIGTVFAWIGRHRAVIVEVAKVLGMLVGILYAVGVAHAVWNAIAAANVVTIVLYAVVAALPLVIYWINKAVDKAGGWSVVWIKAQRTFKVFTVYTLAGLKKMWAGVKLYAKTWGAIGETIWTSLKIGWEYIKRFASNTAAVFKAIGKMILKPWKKDKIWAELQESMSGGFKDIKDKASAEIDGIWSGLTKEYKNEMDTIARLTAGKVAAIDAATQDALAEAARKRAGNSGHEWSLAGVGGAQGMGSIGFGHNKDAWGLFAEKAAGAGATGVGDMSGGGEGQEATSLAQRLEEGMVAPYRTAWDSIIDIEMSGKERRNAIWKSFAGMVHRALGDQLKAHLFTEDSMTKGTEKSLFKRMALSAKERLSDMKTAATSIYKAVAGFFKAHASIPFVGAALAGAAVALMMGSLRKAKPRAMGGPVTAGQPYIVGEKGPEPFIPTQPGHIISNSKFQELLAEGTGRRGPAVVHEHYHVHAAGPVFVEERQMQNLKVQLAGTNLGVDW